MAPQAGHSLLAILALAHMLLAPWGAFALEPSQSQREYLENRGPIRFVSQNSYAPFEFAKDGAIDGMMVELARWISTEYGFRAEFTAMDFKSAQDAVISGEADVITSLFKSDERDELFEFTDTIFEVPAWIFVHKDRYDIRSLSDLEGLVIAMQVGDYAEEYLRDNGVNFDLEPARNFGEAATLVANGEADALLGDEQIVLHDIYELQIRDDIKRVDQPLYIGLNSFAARDGNKQLIEILNAGLKHARENGALQSIQRKWLGAKSPTQFALNQYVYQILWVLAGALLLLAGIAYWNMRLRRAVREKTAELLSEKERFRAIADYSFNWEAWYSNEGALLWVNPAVERITGYPPDECLAITDFPVPLVAADQREEFWSLLESAKRGESFDSRMFRIVRRNGDERWVLVSGQRIRNQANDAAGVRMSFRDSTERVADRLEIERHSALLSSLFDSISDQIYYQSPDGVLLGCNTAFCEFAGMPSEEIVGKKASDVAGLENSLSSNPLTKAIQLYELAAKSAHGDLCELEAVRTPFHDATGHLLGVVTVRRDITERRAKERENAALQERIQSAKKLESLGVLAGGLAHDFNNLLQGILGNIELISEELDEAHPWTESLRDMAIAARQAAELSGEMLAYSGKGALNAKPIDLNQLINLMSDMLRIAAENRAELDYHLGENLPACRADPTQLRQVIINLVRNSCDAMSGDGVHKICVRTSARQLSEDEALATDFHQGPVSGLYLVLVIEDNGSGMSEQTRRRVFDPFFTTKTHGRGLGLASVLGIVRGHGGMIDLESEEGKGTKFTIYFPACEEPAENLAPTPAAIPSPSKFDHRVLLVDDDKSILKIARKMLEKAGYQVETASSGEEAIDQFEQHIQDYHAVVLDMTMPGLSGPEVYHKLRAMNKDIAMLICSGYSEQDVSIKFSGDSQIAFIQKPFTRAELTEKLGKLLA